jgi:hypothetical protein
MGRVSVSVSSLPEHHPESVAGSACVAVSFSPLRREKMILIGGEAEQTDWRAPYQAGVIFGI